MALASRFFGYFSCPNYLATTPVIIYYLLTWVKILNFKNIDSKTYLLTIWSKPSQNLSIYVFSCCLEHSKNFSKMYSLNHHLESHLSKYHFFIFLYFLTAFLYLLCSLESHPCSPSLASMKAGIEDMYIWIFNWRDCCMVNFHQNLYSYKLEKI